MRVPPVSAAPGTPRMFAIEVAGMSGAGVKRSNEVLKVSYDQLNSVMRNTGRSGARIVRVTPIGGTAPIATPSTTSTPAPVTTPAASKPATAHAQVPVNLYKPCLLYTSPSPRDAHESRMPSSA